MTTQRPELRNLRKERGLSQSDLARLCGCGQKMVSNWETGIYEPSLERLSQICVALGLVKTSYSVGEDGIIITPEIHQKFRSVSFYDILQLMSVGPSSGGATGE